METLKDILSFVMLALPCFAQTVGGIIVTIWAITSTIRDFDPDTTSNPR